MEVIFQHALDLLLTASFALLAWRINQNYLLIAQSCEYNVKDYKGVNDYKELAKQCSKNYASIATIISLAVLSPMVYYISPELLGSEISDRIIRMYFLALFCLFFYLNPNPQKLATKPLKITSRVKHLNRISGLLLAMISILAFYLLQTDIDNFESGDRIGHINFTVFAIIVMAAAMASSRHLIVLALKIDQNRKLREDTSYLRQAEVKLMQPQLNKIGITGSYGKTSIKYILSHVLGCYDRTIYAKGSCNTKLGLSSHVNANPIDDCRNYVAEMGSYRLGSIDDVCQLIEPNSGIVSIIGTAHYDKFLALDTVARAKFELADHCIRNRGFIVSFADVQEFEYPRRFIEKNKQHVVLVGSEQTKQHNGNIDYLIEEISQEKTGLKLKFSDVRSKSSTWYEVPIFGHHQTRNIALVVAYCLEYGLSHEQIKRAFLSMEQIENRLQVENLGTLTKINDAYNSNEQGFKSAVDLVGFFATKDRKSERTRTLITPGIVELGEKHDEVHSKLGKFCANKLDYCLLVNANRIKTFEQEIKSGNPDCIVERFDSFPQAYGWFENNILRRHASVVLLIENDLPSIMLPGYSILS